MSSTVLSPSAILIVADDLVTNTLLATWFLTEVDSVRSVVDGRSAIHAVAEERPGLVVAQAKLPDVDSIQLARYLREWDVPVILLGPELDVLPPTGTTLVASPVDLDALVQLARYVLNERRVS